MIQRNKQEQKVYELLLNCRIPEKSICEPDKMPCADDCKRPDFCIDEANLVIEVKHFDDPELLKKDKELLEDFKKQKSVSFWAPEKNDRFEKHLNDAIKKFENYPNYSTLLIEDFSDFHFLKPDIEFLIGGMTTLHLNRNTGELIKYSSNKRHLRIDKNCDIGAVCIITNEGIYIYHNLMANKERIMPYYFWAKQLGDQEFKQFIYIAPPGELSHLYSLELVK